MKKLILIIVLSLSVTFSHAQIFDYIFSSKTEMYSGESYKGEKAVKGGPAFIYNNNQYCILSIAELKKKIIVFPITKLKEGVNSSNQRSVYIEYYNPTKFPDSSEIKSGLTPYPDITVSIEYDSKTTADITVSVSEDLGSHNNRFAGNEAQYFFHGKSDKTKKQEMEKIISTYLATKKKH
jgi:hypothetical protein